MNFKALFQITLLFALPTNTVYAENRLMEIGNHPVHRPPLIKKEDLCKMIQKEKVREWLKKGLKEASCVETGNCSVFYEDIMNLFPKEGKCDQDKFIEIEYKKETAFRWMMFRTQGKGDVKISEDIVWGGEEPISAYQFTITKDGKDYVFAVPKVCGNLALLKTTDCPKCKDNPCEDCGQCSSEIDCLIDDNKCSDKCAQCKKDKCVIGVPKKVFINKCEDCGQCSKEIECLVDEKNCSPTCAQCKQDKCIVGIKLDDRCPANCRQECKDYPDGSICNECKQLNCIEECPPPPICINCDINFFADLGYYRQSDPADYLFGRFGIEYKPFAQDSSFKDVSLLTMIGVAPRIKGDDGDDAFMLDVIAQYNVPSPNMFIGFGLGGWFTSGDVNHDSADSDLDIIANIGLNVGTRVGKSKNADVAVFFEVRNAVDELDALAEYGRFGAGVRFRF